MSMAAKMGSTQMVVDDKQSLYLLIAVLQCIPVYTKSACRGQHDLVYEVGQLICTSVFTASRAYDMRDKSVMASVPPCS